MLSSYRKWAYESKTVLKNRTLIASLRSEIKKAEKVELITTKNKALDEN